MERRGDASQAQLPGIWRFGATVLDEQVAELRVAGQTMALDRSSYDVLLALLRHAGEVVTKEELLEAGWPDRVVSENSLAKAISRLRTVLQDDGAALKVVHGYGYRLTAGVSFLPVARERIEAHPEQPERLREGDRLPHRNGWRLARPLGTGGAGVIWLALSDNDEARAIKFASSEAGLRGLKREIGLSRYIQAVRPGLPGVAPVLGSNLSQPPFFLEMPYYVGGNLHGVHAAAGGLQALPISERLALATSLCEAVADLHEIGVIHKDLKPENLYPQRNANGGWTVVLSDLGAGEAAPSPELAQLGLTMSIAMEHGSPLAGSLLYLAPEVIGGQMPTQRSDVFALGVLLYQLAAGDLRRSLAPGWEDDIADPLLREDIALAAASNPERRQIDARMLADRLRNLGVRREQSEREQRERALAQQREHDLQRERSRRRLWLTAATVAGLGLVGTLGMYAYAEKSRRTAVAEATRADREAKRSHKLVEFLTDGVLRQADPYATAGGGEITLGQAIDNAAKDVDIRFGDDPDTAAAIHGTLGAAYLGLNKWDAGVHHYKAQVSRLRAARPRDAEALAKASGQLCIAQVWQGDPALRRKTCEQARDDYRAAQLEPDLPETFLALVDNREDKPRQGMARLEPRLPRIRASNDAKTRDFALWFASILYGRLGRTRDAERVQAERIALNTHASAGSMDLAWSLTEHAQSLQLLGRTDEGRQELQRAHALFAKVAGADSPYVLVPDIYLANDALARGQWRDARNLAEPAFHTLLARINWDLWTIHAALATMTSQAELGDEKAALRLMAEFESEARKHGLERNFPFLRSAYWQGFAASWLALGEPAKAEPYLRKLQALVAEPDANPLLIGRTQCLESRLQLARNEKHAALASARDCRKRLLDATSPTSPLLEMPNRLLVALDEKP